MSLREREREREILVEDAGDFEGWIVDGLNAYV